MRLTLENGMAMGYDDNGTGEPLVLLHPIGLRRAFWDAAVAYLAEDFRCIAIDLPGHGESETVTGAYTLEALAAACSELVERLAGNAHIAGCSMGAAVAQMIAVNKGACVRSLVLANTSGPRKPGRSAALEARAQLAEKDMAAATSYNIGRWFTKEFAAGNREILDRVSGWLLNGKPCTQAAAWRALAARRDDHYGLIGMPVLVVAGGSDISASPQAARALAEALPQARMAEIAGAGHLAPLEQPRQFAELTRQFVRSQDGTP